MEVDRVLINMLQKVLVCSFTVHIELNLAVVVVQVQQRVQSMEI